MKKNVVKQIELIYVLMIFQYYIEKKLFKPSDIVNYFNHPQAQKYAVVRSLSKKQLRDIWIWQIRHGSLYCEICGNRIESTKACSPMRLTADHRYPVSKGGETSVFNLGPTHSKCNSLKADYTPNDWTIKGKEILDKYNIAVNKKHCRYNYRER